MINLNQPVRPIRSAFCLALAIFLLFNFLLNILDRITPFSKSSIAADRFDYGGTEHKVDELPTAPKIILLGSSLTLYPMWAVDRKFGIDSSDSNHYHRALGLEKELVLHGLPAAGTYDLAVGGAFISDSYLLLEHYLKTHKSPLFVVLDCAPRSFYDSAPRSAASTPIFDFCFTPNDFLALQHCFLPDFSSKVDYLFSRLIFMYHHRQWLSTLRPEELAKCLPRGISSMRTLVQSKLNGRQTDRLSVDTKVLPPLLESPAVPLAPLNLQPAFRKSIEEYRSRYFWINEAQLKPQMSFIKLIEKTCAARHCKLIVVNMPLTEENKKLLPEGFYGLFVQDLKASLAAGTFFLDLDSMPGWSESCYMDSVHLNSTGGSRYNQILAETIAAQTK